MISSSARRRRDGGADVGEQLLVVPWLLDEVVGACRMASTTFSTVPYAVIMMTGSSASRSRISRQNLDAVALGQGEIEQHQVVTDARRCAQPFPPSPAVSTVAFELSRVSSDSRIAASSSMIRMRAG